jgi:D-serine deaminase-like pyridoxal phosphate-dependent protein
VAGHETARIVTVGCTPTSPYSAEHPEVTEVRAGVYAYYDCKQVSLGAATLDDCALTVLSTVVSNPAPRRYILDAGMKALAGEDYGWGTHGRLLEHPDVIITRAAEEHGIINLLEGVADPGLRVGDRVRIVPNHACGCSNMHDRVMAVDGERVLEIWPVIGRGRVQ